MSNKKRYSKRKIKIPGKFVDTICDLNTQKMNKVNLNEYEEEIECGGENEEVRAQTKKLGDSSNKEVTEAEDIELDNRSSVAKDVNVIENGDEAEINTPDAL